MSENDPDLTIIMVSYNTRDLTLAAVRTCLETTVETSFRLVVLDNASPDGSGAALRDAFPPETYPQVEVICSDDNLGFARANNIVAETATTPYILLLNPDTECHPGAVDNLMRFARETPKAGIWGGRTVFPDGRLNAASCYGRITLWSMICRATGLYSAFARSELFNPEALGDWPRDSVREVDIVVGCWLMIGKPLWDELGGFDLKYYMYGEDADLCLRARALGYRPMITPDAQIMHVYGASTAQRANKISAVAKARATLIRDHWPAWQVPLGISLMWLGAGLRAGAARVLGRLKGGRRAEQAQMYHAVWTERHDWLAGFQGD